MRSGTGKPGTGHLVGAAAYFSAMADLMIEGTVKTPTVRLDAASGLLEISGCSVHENADRFYRPLIDAVERAHFEQVLERCGVFARGGGFVFNAIHNIQARTPVENIVAMIDAVRDFNGEIR